MKLVIGGAYQGKREFASGRYNISKTGWTDGNVCSGEDVLNATAVYDFHIFIRRLLGEGQDIGQFVRDLCDKNPQLVIVSDEVGYGIVPVEAEERAWREACGRACTVLAAQADEVTRVCCGIGRRIK